MAATTTQVEVLFDEVCSVDFLKFSFGGRGYQDQLYDAIAKTETLAGVKVECLTFSNKSPTTVNNKVVWVTHNFAFLGGSLGCAEGEKITRAFEYGLEHKVHHTLHLQLLSSEHHQVRSRPVPFSSFIIFTCPIKKLPSIPTHYKLHVSATLPRTHPRRTFFTSKWIRLRHRPESLFS